MTLGPELLATLLHGGLGLSSFPLQLSWEADLSLKHRVNPLTLRGLEEKALRLCGYTPRGLGCTPLATGKMT